MVGSASGSDTAALAAGSRLQSRLKWFLGKHFEESIETGRCKRKFIHTEEA